MRNIIKRYSPELPMFFLGFTIISAVFCLSKYFYRLDFFSHVILILYLSGAIIAWLKCYKKLMRAEDLRCLKD
jgi:uncharacterized membrane protein